MKILLCGANGFVGAYLTAHLLSLGHELTCTSRNVSETKARFPKASVIYANFNHDTAVEDWLLRLDNIEVIINCVGILNGTRTQSMQAIHHDAPMALYQACKQKKIKRIIHLSALGVDSSLDIDYVKTKKACDDALIALGLNSLILRPSLIYGAGSYGGSSLMRAMSALPLLPLIDKGDKRFQPISIPCLMKVFTTFLDNPYRGIIDVVGPETISFKDILKQLRSWLGFTPPRFISFPAKWVKKITSMASCLHKGPISKTSFELLMQENISDDRPLKAEIDFPIQSMSEALSDMPSQTQDKLHARLYFLKPITKLSLIILWFFSGLLPLLFSYNEAADMLGEMGFSKNLSLALTSITCLWDLFIAFGLALSKRVRLFNYIQLLTILCYTLLATLTYSRLWLAPLGPLLKNIPIITLIGVYAMMEER
jgi:uncharacterized protein YbjT (DUF2867 family)